MNELEIIFDEKLVISNTVKFNLDKNVTYYVPKDDPSRDGSQWILDSMRRRYKAEDDEANHHSSSGDG